MNTLMRSASDLASRITAVMGLPWAPKPSHAERTAEKLATMKRLVVDVATLPPDHKRYRSRRTGQR